MECPLAGGAPRLDDYVEPYDCDCRDRPPRRYCSLGECPIYPPLAGEAPRLNPTQLVRSAGALRETLRTRRRPGHTGFDGCAGRSHSARMSSHCPEERSGERPEAEGAPRLDDCVECRARNCRPPRRYRGLGERFSHPLAGGAPRLDPTHRKECVRKETGFERKQRRLISQLRQEVAVQGQGPRL